MRYCPDSSVLVSRTTPVACEVILTDAPATPAPDLSVTVPEMLPVAWPKAFCPQHSATTQNRITNTIRLLILHTPLGNPPTRTFGITAKKENSYLFPRSDREHAESCLDLMQERSDFAPPDTPTTSSILGPKNIEQNYFALVNMSSGCLCNSVAEFASLSAKNAYLVRSVVRHFRLYFGHTPVTFATNRNGAVLGTLGGAFGAPMLTAV